MLQCGNAGLSFEEQKTHFSLWAISAAPLLISTDIRYIGDETLQILKNKEVIEVDQDLGFNGAVQGTQVATQANDTEVWVKRLSNGSSGEARFAVVLVNLAGDSSRDVTVTWEQVGLEDSKTASVRDLWAGKTLGKFSHKFTAKGVAPHGSVMLRLECNER